MAPARILYLWNYLVRRGPRAVKRRMLAVSQSRAALRHRPAGSLHGAIHLGGGIGDQVVYARFMRDLAAAAPGITFDAFSNDGPTTRWLFADVPGFGTAYIDSLFDKAKDGYAFALDLSLSLKVAGRSPEVAEASPALTAILKRIDAFNLAHKDLEPLGVFARPLFGMRQVYANVRRHTSFQHISGIPYGGDRFAFARDPAMVEAHALADKRYVTVHLGFGAEQVTSGRWSTKTYPNYDKVIDQIRLARPELIFIQLGARNSPALPNVDLNLIGRTTMPQVVALMARAVLHLDGESGLVYLASGLGVRSCVVFGPTNPDFFGYEQNANLRPKECGGCWWTTRDWMNACPRGLPQPVCTQSIPPAEVVAAALCLLDFTTSAAR